MNVLQYVFYTAVYYMFHFKYTKVLRVNIKLLHDTLYENTSVSFYLNILQNGVLYSLHTKYTAV